MDRLRLGGLFICRGPTQHAPDRSQQLALVVRLWHVVIGAHFEAEDVINDLAASSQHDDPDTKILTQPAGEDQSVLAGQHQIEGDEIDRGLRHDPAHPRAVVYGRDSVTLARQIFPDEIADLAFIVDNQDVTVVVRTGQLRPTLYIMFQPRRQIDGQVPDGSLKHSNIYGYKLLHKPVGVKIRPIGFGARREAGLRLASNRA